MRKHFKGSFLIFLWRLYQMWGVGQGKSDSRWYSDRLWNVPWLTSSAQRPDSLRRAQTSTSSLKQRGGDGWRGPTFSRPLSRPLSHHYLHPHSAPWRVIDGECAPWHGTQPRARTPLRAADMRNRPEDLNLICAAEKSAGADFTPYTVHKSGVVTHDNVMLRQPGV